MEKGERRILANIRSRTRLKIAQGAQALIRKCLGLVVLILAIALATTGTAANSPTLRNDMPDYLKGFQTTVNRQVSTYPDIYFLAGPEDAPSIALTFDDGPAGDNTAQLLDVLASEQVKAT